MAKEIIPIVIKNGIKLAALDKYKSLIWTTRYYAHGDFEIQIEATPQIISLLEIGNYIAREDDNNLGVIEKLDYKVTETNEQIIIASGRFLTTFLERRIVAEQTQVSGDLSDCINKLLNENAISPDLGVRNLPIVYDDYSIPYHLEAQYTGKTLYTIINELALQYHFGFKIYYDKETDKFTFTAYYGKDRTYDQDVNPRMIFSDEYENLINAEFQKDSKGMVTAVLAAGEGEGIDRKTIWVESGEYVTGLERYEYFDDNRNISSNNGEISEEDYMQQLAENGRANFTSYTSTFGGEVNFTNVKYREDVDIGDVCVIENKALGYTTKARIIEVIESIDSSGAYSVIPTFGT